MEPPSPTKRRLTPEALLRDRRQGGRHAGIERWGDPPLGGGFHVDRDVRPFVRADGRDDRVRRDLRVHVGRQSQREFQRRRGAQDVAAVAWLGQAVCAGDLQGRSPGAGDQAIDRVGREEVQAVDDGRRAVGVLGRQHLEVGALFLGDAGPLELGQEDAAGRLVLDVREDAAQDPKRRRDDATALAAVDALGEHVDLDGRHQVPAQRRREPETVVAEPSRIEADHEPGRADALLEVRQVGQQVRAPALLAGLDEDEDAAIARRPPPTGP